MRILAALVTCCLAVVAVPAHAVQTLAGKHDPMVSDFTLCIISLVLALMAVSVVCCVRRCDVCSGVNPDTNNEVLS